MNTASDSFASILSALGQGLPMLLQFVLVLVLLIVA
jgi:hypothetical protein